MGTFRYVALDVKVVIEITPKVQPPRMTSPEPIRQPVLSPAPQSQTNWGRVIGVGLIATGTVIIVGTLVEDFFTAGIGVADDPPTLAAGSAAIVRGLAMAGVAGVAVLPQANTPANVKMKTTVELQ